MKFCSFLLVVVVLFAACKKGEDDPFLSLKTRDARIRGEWKLVERTSADSDGQERLFDGTTMTIKQDGVVTDSYPYQLVYAFEKGGRLKYSKTQDGESYSGEDYWGWQNTNKKKSVLMLYNNDYYHIRRLSNKELVLEQNYTGSEYEVTDAYSNTLKFEKQ